jgi:rRNA processing protein Gar1
MDSFATTDPLHEVTVYDVRGNAIGTVAEIFGDAPHESASAAAHPRGAIPE